MAAGPTSAVARARLQVVLASVMAGIAVLLTMLAVAYQPFLLLAALPFALAAYLMWQGATGGFRFGGRRRDRVGEGARRAAAEAARRRAGVGGPGDGDPEAARDGARSRFAGGPGFAADSRFAAGTEYRERVREERRRARQRRRRAGAQPAEGMSRREAYRVLDLDGDADADDVAAAYRCKVKETHPDTEDGDEEAFKRVTDAYERLSE